MANVNPTLEDVMGKLTELRKSFGEKYKDNVSSQVYDRRDLSRLEDDDVYACCFLRTLANSGDVMKTVHSIHETFMFRKQYGLWDLTDASFERALVDKRAMYFKGEDIDGHPILYVCMKDITARLGTAEWKKYLAYIMDRHHRRNPGQMCVLLFDMDNAGAANSNAELVKFAIKSCATYFPAFLAYLLTYELNSFLNGAFWQVMKTFISNEQRKKIIMLNKQNISKYINQQNLWPHMK